MKAVVGRASFAKTQNVVGRASCVVRKNQENIGRASCAKNTSPDSLVPLEKLHGAFVLLGGGQG